MSDFFSDCSFGSFFPEKQKSCEKQISLEEKSTIEQSDAFSLNISNDFSSCCFGCSCSSLVLSDPLGSSGDTLSFRSCGSLLSSSNNSSFAETERNHQHKNNNNENSSFYCSTNRSVAPTVITAATAVAERHEKLCKSVKEKGVNVKVIVRCRPQQEFEKKDPNNFICVEMKNETREVVIKQLLSRSALTSSSSNNNNSIANSNNSSSLHSSFNAGAAYAINASNHMYNKKTFVFDGVCSDNMKQEDLFKKYMIPIIDEVLLGFNCTIFAYGQTGTGKTYTMEGDMSNILQSYLSDSSYYNTAENAAPDGFAHGMNDTLSSCLSSLLSSSYPRSKPPKQISPPASHSLLSEKAGIIPRAVQRIFTCLDSQQLESSIRVSYLEIYNEELCDLLSNNWSAEGTEAGVHKLRIYEDSSGRKGLNVDKLEEIPVNHPHDIYSILSLAGNRRKRGETLMNKNSSRSHSIFSIIIHIKESSSTGEDVLKIGKLNLVDLAGSENIQRSGCLFFNNSNYSYVAKKERLKETGMINQSLLTLGRVINALVENSPYVPYRDSKLTRLLQDSLGGRTKTCIVATISPSSLCLEETLNTLDYAYRAKNIRNSPEINKKMTKRVMIKELNKEIERLKIELISAREKDGVYLPFQKFKEIEEEMREKRKQLDDNEKQIKENIKNLEIIQEANLQINKVLENEIIKNEGYRERLDARERELLHKQNTIQKMSEELKRENFVSNVLAESECFFLNKTKDMISKLFSAHCDLHRAEFNVKSMQLKEKEKQIKFEDFSENMKQSELKILEKKMKFEKTELMFQENLNKIIDQFLNLEKNLYLKTSDKLSRMKDFQVDGYEELKEKLLKLLENQKQIKKNYLDQMTYLKNNFDLVFENIKEEEETTCEKIKKNLNENLKFAQKNYLSLIDNFENTYNILQKFLEFFDEKIDIFKTKTLSDFSDLFCFIKNFQNKIDAFELKNRNFAVRKTEELSFQINKLIKDSFNDITTHIERDSQEIKDDLNKTHTHLENLAKHSQKEIEELSNRSKEVQNDFKERGNIIKESILNSKQKVVDENNSLVQNLSLNKMNKKGKIEELQKSILDLQDYSTKGANSMIENAEENFKEIQKNYSDKLDIFSEKLNDTQRNLLNHVENDVENFKKEQKGNILSTQNVSNAFLRNLENFIERSNELVSTLKIDFQKQNQEKKLDTEYVNKIKEENYYLNEILSPKTQKKFFFPENFLQNPTLLNSRKDQLRNQCSKCEESDFSVKGSEDINTEESGLEANGKMRINEGARECNSTGVHKNSEEVLCDSCYSCCASGISCVSEERRKDESSFVDVCCASSASCAQAESSPNDREVVAEEGKKEKNAKEACFALQTVGFAAKNEKNLKNVKSIHKVQNKSGTRISECKKKKKKVLSASSNDTHCSALSSPYKRTSSKKINMIAFDVSSSFPPPPATNKKLGANTQDAAFSGVSQNISQSEDNNGSSSSSSATAAALKSSKSSSACLNRTLKKLSNFT